MNTIKLQPWVDWADEIKGLTLIDASPGPDNAIWVLASTPFAEKKTGWHYKVDPHDLTVLRVDENGIEKWLIPGFDRELHFVQPLPGDELLLVWGRCRRFEGGKADLNATVYDRKGNFLREFLLGDGIEHVQTTKDGKIWTGYFDEGIFGNMGWDKPVGKSGLICWDNHGKRLYDYSPPDSIDEMVSCDALNVSSEQEAWICYDIPFPLVLIRDFQVADYWHTHGYYHSIGVWEKHALLHCFVNEFHLYQMQTHHQMKKTRKYAFKGKNRHAFKRFQTVGRGSVYYFLHETDCYRFDIRELID